MFRITRTAKGFTLVEIMIVVAIIGILVAIAVPGFINARAQSRAKSCQEQQEKADGATQEWSLETGAAEGTVPTYAILVGPTSYLNKTPQCPIGPTDIALVANNLQNACPSGGAALTPSHSR